MVKDKKKEKRRAEETKEERKERKRLKKEKKILLEDDEKTENGNIAAVKDQEIIDTVKEGIVVVKDQHIDSYRPDAKVEKIPGNFNLESLSLSASTLKSLRERKVTQLFPIQAAAFDHIMAGKDLLARARTGTGFPPSNFRENSGFFASHG